MTQQNFEGPRQKSPTELAKERAEKLGAPVVAPLARSNPPLTQQNTNVSSPRQRDPELIKQDFHKAVDVLAGKAPPIEEQEEVKPKGATVGDFKEEALWNQYRSAVEEYSAERDIEGSQVTYQHASVRKAIESRMTALAIEDLILNDSVTQSQIIIPGKLEVVFRSLTTSEDLELKNFVYELVGSDRYVLDCLTVMTLTCGLVSINGAQLPSHLVEKEGQAVFDKERFEKKYAAVKRLGLHIVALMSVSFMWFDNRIRKELIDSVLGKS